MREREEGVREGEGAVLLTLFWKGLGLAFWGGY